VTGIKDSIDRMGEDHAMQQVLEGGGPSGHCGHHSHADEERRRLEDIRHRLDHIEQAEIDQTAELNGLALLVSQIGDSVRRLLRFRRR
jgi:hypothetical protein